ncbi:hypothetical protein [Deinococcus sp. Marseille-Q6407]|uniref:hypothetical protein n=1 Tax=Deinococcus sp. Marseille-Q6407 TaxID=2969223 RepID=UPI0021C1534D|nr:hypothetical protein [Deinococcus sp. Marseille-Q6407]
MPALLCRPVRTLALALLSGLLCAGSGLAATAGLHIFQTKSGQQIYTTVAPARGVAVRGNQLYYRQNPNLNGRVLFDADQYGKNSVLLSAALGRQNEVYVLANLQKGTESQSTVLRIRISDGLVLNKLPLRQLGLDNVSPAGFAYDQSTGAVKVQAGRGDMVRSGIPSARSGTFWVRVAGKPSIVRERLD